MLTPSTPRVAVVLTIIKTSCHVRESAILHNDHVAGRKCTVGDLPSRISRTAIVNKTFVFTSFLPDTRYRSTSSKFDRSFGPPAKEIS